MPQSIDARALEEAWLDAALADSFPASDPVSLHWPSVARTAPGASAECWSETEMGSVDAPRCETAPVQTMVGVIPPSTRSAAPFVADESGLAT
jgi:hypothetical protein